MNGVTNSIISYLKVVRHLDVLRWPLRTALLLEKAPMSEADTSAETYEEQHVHSVYESIASHFSATRYKVRRLCYQKEPP